MKNSASDLQHALRTSWWNLIQTFDTVIPCFSLYASFNEDEASWAGRNAVAASAAPEVRLDVRGPDAEKRVAPPWQAQVAPPSGQRHSRCIDVVHSRREHRQSVDGQPSAPG